MNITRLWGKIFWAVGLENKKRAPGMKMCWYQAFTGKSHIPEFRLLPIFAVIFNDALLDPLWGEAARQEFLLTNGMNTLVPISSEDGRTLVSGGADRVMHFPVYERKIKEGKEVIKARPVCRLEEKVEVSMVLW
jgi:hypothetical protein